MLLQRYWTLDYMFLGRPVTSGIIWKISTRENYPWNAKHVGKNLKVSLICKKKLKKLTHIHGKLILHSAIYKTIKIHEKISNSSQDTLFYRENRWNLALCTVIISFEIIILMIFIIITNIWFCNLTWRHYF